MRKAKKARLEAAGWKLGSAQDFLELTDEEVELIEIKLVLAHSLKLRRTRRRLSQAQLAKTVGSSQSRVAKMEAADPSVSVDLLIRALLMLGASRRDVAAIIGSKAA